MHIFIRVEGNPNIGLGHIMRCYALAQGCEARGLSVTFLCSEESALFLRSRQGFSSAIFVLNYSEKSISKGPRKAWVDELRTLIYSTDVLVVDGYQFDFEYQQTLKNAGFKFAYFDDINSFWEESQEHQADVIINGAMSALTLNYESNAANSVRCLGSDYALLRKEFHALQPPPLNQRQHLLINFGGADSHDYSRQLLLALNDLQFCAPIYLITGAAYQFVEPLQTCIRECLDTSRMRVKHIHDSQNLAKHMQNSMLAVCAAGATQFELLACATPSILVVVADNQLPASRYASEQGWCDIVTWQEQSDVKALAKHIVQTWNTPQKLVEKFEAALQCQKQLSFAGAKNIIDVLEELAQ